MEAALQPPSPRPRRAALYLRASTAKKITGREDYTQRPEIQEERLRQVCEQRGGQLVAVNSDHPQVSPRRRRSVKLARQFGRPASGKGPFHRRRNLLAQARELAVLRENSGSSPRTPAAEVEMEKPAWERILTAIGPSLALHLDKFLAALGMTAERLLARLILSGPQNTAAAPWLAAVPPAIRQPQAAAVEATPAAAVDPAAAQRQQLMALVSQYAPTILAGINSEDPMEAGAALADVIAILTGEGTYYALAALGREG